MRVRQVRRTQMLLFDGTIVKREKIKKVFGDVKKVSVPFNLTDVNNKTIYVIKILEIHDEHILVLEKAGNHTLKHKVKYDDILDVYIETTSKIDRALCVNEWRALEI